MKGLFQCPPYISACIYKLQGLKADNDCKDIYFFYKKDSFSYFFFRIDGDFIKNVIKSSFLGQSENLIRTASFTMTTWR